MHTITWWAYVAVLVVASGIDLATRRIPNWLSIPFLVAGLVVQTGSAGWRGLGQSMAGMGLAVMLFGLPCFLRAMGMGDLKLAVGVGAWIGPGQFMMAFVVTGIVGGVLAVFFALGRRSLGRCLDNAGELVFHLSKGRIPPHEDIRLASETRSIPYAPAIAAGALFSFLMV